MTEPRTYPPYFADERAMLDAWLDYHRATLLMKCDGLNAEQLRSRAVPPSTMSLLGLVRHMHEVEQWWFRRTLGGDEIGSLYCTDDRPDGDFDDIDTADVVGALAALRAEMAHARTVVAAATSLDAEAARRRNNGDAVSVRWIITHMVEEYARHNGHADLLRQCIDGQTGD